MGIPVGAEEELHASTAAGSTTTTPRRRILNERALRTAPRRRTIRKRHSAAPRTPEARPATGGYSAASVASHLSRMSLGRPRSALTHPTGFCGAATASTRPGANRAASFRLTRYPCVVKRRSISARARFSLLSALRASTSVSNSVASMLRSSVRTPASSARRRSISEMSPALMRSGSLKHNCGKRGQAPPRL